MPYLQQLAAGNSDTWNDAFRVLYPVAFEAARSRLSDKLPNEIEDVAIESLYELLGRVAELGSEDELKPFLAAISRNKATDRLRRYLADKRGGSRVTSLDVLMESNDCEPAEFSNADFLDQLTLKELQELLTDLSETVKKEYRIVLKDHFFNDLSYKEIAEKRNISVGSVGVFLQRGLALLRRVLIRRPQLQKEFLALLSDATVVRGLLPLATAIELGGWFWAELKFCPSNDVHPQLSEDPPDVIVRPVSFQRKLTDQDRLQMVDEFPEVRCLREFQRTALLGKVKPKIN